jgi:hypothetical protein
VSCGLACLPIGFCAVSCVSPLRSSVPSSWSAGIRPICAVGFWSLVLRLLHACLATDVHERVRQGRVLQGALRRPLPPLRLVSFIFSVHFCPIHHPCLDLPLTRVEFVSQLPPADQLGRPHGRQETLPRALPALPSLPEDAHSQRARVSSRLHVWLISGRCLNLCCVGSQEQAVRWPGVVRRRCPLFLLELDSEATLVISSPFSGCLAGTFCSEDFGKLVGASKCPQCDKHIVEGKVRTR